VTLEAYIFTDRSYQKHTQSLRLVGHGNSISPNISLDHMVADIKYKTAKN
jgi:hypothetical protein